MEGIGLAENIVDAAAARMGHTVINILQAELVREK